MASSISTSNCSHLFCHIYIKCFQLEAFDQFLCSVYRPVRMLNHLLMLLISAYILIHMCHNTFYCCKLWYARIDFYFEKSAHTKYLLALCSVSIYETCAVRACVCVYALHANVNDIIAHKSEIITKPWPWSKCIQKRHSDPYKIQVKINIMLLRLYFQRFNFLLCR